MAEMVATVAEEVEARVTTVDPGVTGVTTEAAGAPVTGPAPSEVMLAVKLAVGAAAGETAMIAAGNAAAVIEADAHTVVDVAEVIAAKMVVEGGVAADSGLKGVAHAGVM